MPKMMAPSTRGRSISVLAGRWKSWPRRGCRRAPAIRNPMAATTKAPIMTRARLGSHSPAISRKPWTFAGSIMREMTSPSPKSRPAANGERMRQIPMILTPDNMTQQEHCDYAAEGECGGGQERALGEARRSANAMAAGAAPAEAGSEADQKSACHQQQRRAGDGDRSDTGDHLIDQGCCKQPGEEGDAPHTIVAGRRGETAQDAADPRDPAVEEPEHKAGAADHQAADEGSARSEIFHGRQPPSSGGVELRRIQPRHSLWYRHLCRMRCVIAALTTDTGGLPVLIFLQLFDPQSS